jgi:hypothetical protein
MSLSRAKSEPRPDWIDGEARLGAAMRAEVVHLRRRAWRRPLVLLGVVLLATAAVVGKVVLPARVYQTEVVIRLVEGLIDTSTEPSTTAAISGYVADVAFSSEHLLELIHRHELYSRYLARDPRLAVEKFRDDIGIDCWRNYFASARDYGELGRSAHITVTYRALDAELAYRVAQDLAQLVIDSYQAQRRESADQAAALAQEQMTQIAAEVDRRKAEIASQEQRLAEHYSARELVELTTRKELLAGLQHLLGNRRALSESLEFRSALEREDLGMDFEIVDRGAVDKPMMSRRLVAATTAAVVFPVVLLLCTLAIGSFDQRVHDRADLRRIGLEPLGEIGPFPGRQSVV